MPLSAFTNTFAGNPLDRASDRRSDEAWLSGQLASAESLALAVWNGRPLVEKTSGGGVQIAYLPARLAGELSGGPERLLFLGLWKETAVFAVDLEGFSDPTEGPLQGLGEFADLRQVALALPGPEAAICATAKSMFEWRRKHRRCANCGEPTDVKDAGWKRQCPACETEHFPRTDPVVIMLPYHGGRCMLGRQEAWPKGMFSALAGFLEPGESIEAAVARELHEEAGIAVTEVTYVASQPWPFPSSLMLGCHARALGDQLTIDFTELDDARWFTREEIAAAIAGDLDATFQPPPRFAIARTLLDHWLAS